MNKFVAVYTACTLLVLLIAGQAAEPASGVPDDGSQEMEEPLDSELQLKKMVNYVAPLMAIFQLRRKRRSTSEEEEVENPHNNHQEEEASNHETEDTSLMVESARARGRRPPPQQLVAQSTQSERNGYGDYGAASSYGYGGGGGGGGGGYGGYQQSYSCCDKKDELLPILALTALSLLLLYLIAIATTTTTAAGGRRRRSEDDNMIDEGHQDEIDLLDAPTWMSMVEELWEADDEDSDICALKALCRMNRLALTAPGSAGMAVSLSSVPLSYLLHHRHEGGFMRYLDASLMGRYGENCTAIFSGCHRLN